MKHLKKTFILIFLVALSAHGQQSDYASEEKLREHQAKEAIRRAGTSICQVTPENGSTEQSYRLYIDMVYMRHISFYARETLKQIAQARNETERFSLERKFQNYHLELSALQTVYSSNERVECPEHNLVHPMYLENYVEILEAMVKAKIPLPEEKK